LRYAIISDIHGNLEALQCVLDHIAAAGVDAVACLGDVVGYNANPNECANIIRERGIPTIMGNHDAVACMLEEPWGFNPVALQAAMWTREQLSGENLSWLQQLPMHLEYDHFMCVHGAPGDRDLYVFSWEDIIPHLGFLEETQRRLCFFGHTHMPGIFSADGAYSLDDDHCFDTGEGKPFFINPGSVGQPRDGDPRAAYGLYDAESGLFEQVRLEYPVEEAARRVRDAGLPPFLAERLGLGR
jgi:predicted phosphodiesterase